MSNSPRSIKLRPTAWLWWLSLLIATAAVLIIYFIQNDPAIFDARQKISTVILGAAILIGICIISATSHWWLKR